jgi:4,5-dihydroxyphthalate decarboxylase
MTQSPVTLRVAIGDYPHTLPLKRGEITSPMLTLDFIEKKPMHTAFKPMVREHAFDVSELALVTVLQAKAYNKGLRLLPAAMLSRFQHHTCLYNSARGEMGPSDLAGKRIGLRSYSQTTGAYIRGIIENDYGVDLSGVQWVTFEDGHVAEAKDPDDVIRARPDQDITQMLIDGELDAAIYGAAMPDDPRLKSVIPDPESAALAWYGRHGVIPVNHMVVVTDEIARAQPQAIAEFYRLLEESKRAAGLPKAGEIDATPFGREQNRPCLEMLIGYAVQQKLIPRRLSVDELW